jgi:hypothetical protein
MAEEDHQGIRQQSEREQPDRHGQPGNDCDNQHDDRQRLARCKECKFHGHRCALNTLCL